MEINFPKIILLIAYITAFLIAVIGHEIMHGFVAKCYGDNTASLEGRLSINPLRHIDLVGSVIFPLMLLFAQAPFIFGWAKPVPVDFQLITQRKGFIPATFVSLAGIFYNLLLALIVSIILKYFFLPFHSDYFFEIFLYSFLLGLVQFNVMLGIFNLFPIPPLDGSRALGFVCLYLGCQTLPRWLIKIERYGFVIILIILATPLSKILFQPVELLIKFLLF